MAITSNESGIMITGEHIAVFQILRVGFALRTEIKTGLKMSHGSIMNLAKQYCGSPKRTKKGVLADYAKWMESNGMDASRLKL
jgi:hypothetical protein